MKAFLLTLISFFFLTTGYCQNIELSVFGNASFFSYVGNAKALSAPLPAGYGPPYQVTFLTGNVFGGYLASGFTTGIQTQYVAKSGFIAGLQAAYENLRSYERITYNDAQGPIIGDLYFRSDYLTLSPYLGYRFNTHYLKIDVMPGMDFAFDGEPDVYGNARYEGHDYTITQAYGDLKSDIRARLGVTAWRKRIGVTASYSHGLTNFQNNPPMDYAPNRTYSQVLRLGLIFRVL